MPQMTAFFLPWEGGGAGEWCWGLAAGRGGADGWWWW